MSLFEKNGPASESKGQGLFRMSTPTGYFVKDVDVAIEKYNSTIATLQQTILGQQQIIREKDEKIDSLELTIMNMRLDLSMIEAPSMAASQEHLNLFEFRQKNKSNINIPKQDPFEGTEIVRPSNIPENQVIMTEEDKTSLDDLLGFGDKKDDGQLLNDFFIVE